MTINRISNSLKFQQLQLTHAQVSFSKFNETNNLITSVLLWNVRKKGCFNCQQKIILTMKTVDFETDNIISF